MLSNCMKSGASFFLKAPGISFKLSQKNAQFRAISSLQSYNFNSPHVATSSKKMFIVPTLSPFLAQHNLSLSGNNHNFSTVPLEKTSGEDQAEMSFNVLKPEVVVRIKEEFEVRSIKQI